MLVSNDLYLSDMLLTSPVLTSKRLGRWLTRRRLQALKHLPDNEELINKVFKDCVVLIFMMKNSRTARNKILSILEFQQENKWMIFLDRLTFCNNTNQNTLAILLLKILVQELISKEKACRKYWNAAFNKLSEKLSLPIEIDYLDSDLTLSNNLLKRVEEGSPFLKVVHLTNPHSKNYLKTYCQSYMSSIVDKWEEEVTQPKLKTLKLKIKPSKEQVVQLQEFFDVSRYVYNRTLEYIKEEKYELDTRNLQNLLVTKNTKTYHPIYKYFNKIIEEVQFQIKQLNKNEHQEQIENLNKQLEAIRLDKTESVKSIPLKRNPLVSDFELRVPKDIRDCAVQQVVSAYKSGYTNLRRGNIKYFNMEYKKKSHRQNFEVTKKLISIKDGKVKIAPKTITSEFNLGKHDAKKYKDLEIKHNCDIVKDKGEYFIHVPIDVETKKKPLKTDCFCGVDPGLRVFATTFHNDGSTTEYRQNQILLNKLNNKIKRMKAARERILPFNFLRRKCFKKKQFNKIEKKMNNFIDSLHWDVINHLLKENDTIFMGDIKSHDIVKNGKNRTNNRTFNNLKFFKFKQRLLYKASSMKNKVVKWVNEAYTSQYCSSCGTLNKIGASKKYVCAKCHMKADRDTNSAKNILMKGLIL